MGIAFGDFLVARHNSSELGSALSPTSVPTKTGGEYWRCKTRDMVSIVSRVLFFAREIELGGVENVLPNDIKARCEGSDGIEVG